MLKIISKIPSFLWVFLLPLCIIAFIGCIILLFFLLANVEGVASIIMILAFLIALRFTGNPDDWNGVQDKYSGLWLGLAISFFALMGMAIDQPGNYLYNKPLEIFFCADNTSLSRYVVVTNPLPGRTDMTQSFDCVDSNGEIVNNVNMFQVIAVRFFEYTLIGYGLIYLNRFIRFVRAKYAIESHGN